MFFFVFAFGTSVTNSTRDEGAVNIRYVGRVCCQQHLLCIRQIEDGCIVVRRLRGLCGSEKIVLLSQRHDVRLFAHWLRRSTTRPQRGAPVGLMETNFSKIVVNTLVLCRRVVPQVCVCVCVCAM